MKLPIPCRALIPLFLVALTASPACSKKGGAPGQSSPQAGASGEVQSSHEVSTPGSTSPAASTPKPAARPLAPPCTTLTFRPKNAAEPASHRNLIRLGTHAFNSRSVCIRVDDRPVRFKTVKGRPGEFVIGALGSSGKGRVTVSYCTGKARCPASCVVPKDDFLDAIGADNEDQKTANNSNDGQWDPSQKESDLSAHLDSELRKALGKDAEDPDSESRVYAGWVNDGESPSCPAQQARL